ncbi:hypothetical protein [Maritalea porphyrae]|uniref:hypothetical protein n=1 Tax=Maritalea porphyrae TaxID=880732 RepID=UPI0022AF72D6|nr:hypothetical protein [Maritalea porphyrae]MCZ4273353.1 hypothetical protein [Maritalea porphyrae]
MNLSDLIRKPTLVVLAATALNASAIAEDSVAIMIDEGIWIESPKLKHNSEGVLEAFVVVNNRTDRVIAVNSISANRLGDIQIVNRSGATVALPLYIPIHSELYIQPESVRIQISPYQGPIEVDSAIFSIALGELDPVDVSFRYVEANKPLPDHHDYKHCEIC